MKLALYVKSHQQTEQPVHYYIWSIVSDSIFAAEKHILCF